MYLRPELLSGDCPVDKLDWLSDDIGRYADHEGVSFLKAAKMLLEEAVLLQGLKDQNFEEMTRSGVVRKVLQTFQAHGQLTQLGERKLVVADDWLYCKKPIQERTDDDAFADPPILLAVIADRFELGEKVPTASVGRPDSTGVLQLSDGFTSSDYDVVAECVGRIREAKKAGDLPNVHMLHQHWVPRNFVGDPTSVSDLPLGYTAVA